MRSPRRASVVVAASVFVALMTCAELAVADVITDWNTIALQAILAANAQSGELRDLAMMHVAQFDALNSVEQRYAQYSKLPTYLPNAAGADEGAAANQAAYSILVNVLPSQKSTFDSTVRNSRSRASARRSFRRPVGLPELRIPCPGQRVVRA